MEHILILAGLICFGLGVGYLFKPQWIVVLNSLVRDHLFNDAKVLLHGRRTGVWLLFFAFLCLAIANLRNG